MSDLERVAKMANVMLAQEDRIAVLEQDLRNAKAALNQVKLIDLPELMREVGLSEVRLTSGQKLVIKEDINCGITEENRADAMRWLTEHGFGGIIKTVVAVSFGRDEADAAVALAEKLQAEQYAATASETVHPATLKALLKEQLEAGRSVPFDLFSIYPFTFATFTKK